MTKVSIGTKVKIISDNPNYDAYRNKILEIVKISRSVKDHPGYDEDVGGELYDLMCENKYVGFSLYDWEIKRA